MSDDPADSGDESEPDDQSDDHGLPPEDLKYPEFVFEEGEIADDGSFELEMSARLTPEA